MSNDLNRLVVALFDTTDGIYADVVNERAKQILKWGRRSLDGIHETSGNEYTVTCREAKENCERQAKMGTIGWDDILYEEVAEAFEAYAKGDMQEYRKELIQVAAVVFAMLENLDYGQA